MDLKAYKSSDFRDKVRLKTGFICCLALNEYLHLSGPYFSSLNNEDNSDFYFNSVDIMGQNNVSIIVSSDFCPLTLSKSLTLTNPRILGVV